jgi:hypothetical protein
LFRINWPDASAKRKGALATAIDLAERSAAAGHAQEGLRNARIGAVATAGVAINAIYGHPSDEVGPPDGNMGMIAANVAKVAEHAVTAAEAGDSAMSALEAYVIALDSASDDSQVTKAIKADLEVLHELAVEEKWTDTTAVSKDIWLTGGKDR